MRGSDENGFFWHGGFPPPMHIPAANWGRNTYNHLYNAAIGTGCTAECEACEWNRLRALRQREDLAQPPQQYTPTDDDMKFMADMKVNWYGDTR